jgi:hypothetical protein
VKATKEQVSQALPLLRRAARAKVEYYNALRAIENEVIGYDVTGLDDGVETLAFNCDTPEETDRISEQDAASVLKHVKEEGR